MNVIENQPNEVGIEAPLSAGSEQEMSAETPAEQLVGQEAQLRETLKKLELTPEQTSDDIAEQYSRDDELLRDVPPHHRNF